MNYIIEFYNPSPPPNTLTKEVIMKYQQECKVVKLSEKEVKEAIKFVNKLIALKTSDITKIFNCKKVKTKKM